MFKQFSNFVVACSLFSAVTLMTGSASAEERYGQGQGASQEKQLPSKGKRAKQSGASSGGGSSSRVSR